MSEELEGHLDTLIPAIAGGRVTFFLGAGVNLCDRAEGQTWQPGKDLPNGIELAKHLSDVLGYPRSEMLTHCPSCEKEVMSEKMKDLTRVSQCVSVMAGSAPLYEELHSLLVKDYPPTALHQFIAALPGALREKGYPNRHQFVVTTNYDDLMEQAFRKAGEEFDLVTYLAEGNDRGKFLHRLPDGNEHIITVPNEYRNVTPDKRTVILKVHGTVDRVNNERDSFVITEDHYIDYLTRTDVSKLIPVGLTGRLNHTNFLFLGYSLCDWNLRAILHRIWGEQKLNYKSWAIQLKPSLIDKDSWEKRGVKIIDVSLSAYVSRLKERVQNLKQAGGTS
jgi:SIR2-like domain